MYKWLYISISVQYDFWNVIFAKNKFYLFLYKYENNGFLRTNFKNKLSGNNLIILRCTPTSDATYSSSMPVLEIIIFIVYHVHGFSRIKLLFNLNHSHNLQSKYSIYMYVSYTEKMFFENK